MGQEVREAGVVVVIGEDEGVVALEEADGETDTDDDVQISGRGEVNSGPGGEGLPTGLKMIAAAKVGVAGSTQTKMM